MESLQTMKELRRWMLLGPIYAAGIVCCRLMLRTDRAT